MNFLSYPVRKGFLFPFHSDKGTGMQTKSRTCQIHRVQSEGQCGNLDPVPSDFSRFPLDILSQN